jgi:hypothetical protein
MTDQVVTDPLGRTITLHDRTWFGHICRGHPEMAQHRHRVIDTIRRPDEIRYSRSSTTARLYFAAGPRPTVIMVVVVDIQLMLVKTAYLARAGKVTGAVEWP